MTPDQHATFILPNSVVTRADLSRVLSELEWLDGELTTYAVRTQSGVQVHFPPLSQGLTDFLTQNKLQIAEGKARSAIIAQLRALKNKAPVVHMTFAVSADRASLQLLADWMRKEIHPHALITVGMQPDLVAGVYLRTPNHVHDLSLRASLHGQHAILAKQLDGFLHGAKTA